MRLGFFSPSTIMGHRIQAQCSSPSGAPSILELLNYQADLGLLHRPACLALLRRPACLGLLRHLACLGLRRRPALGLLHHLACLGPLRRLAWLGLLRRPNPAAEVREDLWISNLGRLNWSAFLISTRGLSRWYLT